MIFLFVFLVLFVLIFISPHIVWKLKGLHQEYFSFTPPQATGAFLGGKRVDICP